MDPQLVALSGPHKGTIFKLHEEITIGRDASNHVAISDKSVSRHHCTLRKEGTGWKILDLNSHNGTFVNNVPVAEHLISHGDRIQVGSSLFLVFLDAVQASSAEHDFYFNDAAPLTLSKSHINVEDALNVLARDLGALVRVGTSIASISSLESLQRQLLEAAFEIVPARRGALVLFEGGLTHVKSVYSLNKLTGKGEPMVVSRAVAQQVVSERVAVMSSSLAPGGGQLQSESLSESNVISLLCVPLLTRGEVTGLIYLDTDVEGAHFVERHLQLMSALAGFIAGILENRHYVEWLKAENRRLREELTLEHNMVGDSRRMRDIYSLISKAALTDSTILIAGESGTGKELAARAIHLSSPRANKPFVAINCATLTETLLESELFGHEKGAFTGAFAQKKGKFEVADGGTLFLDEVTEMIPQTQAKLLRVLQEREFERLGGTRPLKLNIRVIAATNKDLESAVAGGSFRRDLYYRLNVISLTMPPLRERPEDIPLLANYFVAKYSGKCKRHVTGLSASARDCLLAYDWPGNVRELENVIERAVVLGSTEQIQVEDLPESISLSAAPSFPNNNRYYDVVREAKRQAILKAIEQAQGSYTEAAKLLGIHPNNLHRLIRNMDLKSALHK